MKRTQIYLSEEEWKVLHDLMSLEKKSLAQLIRDAVDKVYGRRKFKFLEALHAAAGMWKGRTDLGSSEKYVRKLRQDSRSKRFIHA